MSDYKDICKHLDLPPSAEVQAAYEKSQRLQAEQKEAGEAWVKLLDAHRKAQPLMDRLLFAATARCPCGAGLAYDQGNAGFNGSWDCSAILMGTADKSVKHTDRLPFMYYDVKSERQPSAQGATTRPK